MGVGNKEGTETVVICCVVLWSEKVDKIRKP